ncbi:MAG: ATP-binding protein [Mariprofundaceae bacterium]|nr:ATP-binding protein [Mariprofundaceae bacterium]
MTEMIHASPTKRFFVSMLTRDIELEDAILDLLDNCIDGILRTHTVAETPTPYDSYFANIEFDREHFKIEDNCGGIPYKLATEYAFMMGRPHDENDTDIPTVGMYGIGMKRAMFKMGRESSVYSSTEKDSFSVSISPGWLETDSDWELPLEHMDSSLGEAGTIIEVKSLQEGIAQRFDSKSFHADMETLIRTHYSFIIQKGFQISINGTEVKPRLTGLLMSPSSTPEDERIMPYVFKGNFDDVEINLAVGFFRPMPNLEELDEEQITRRSKDDAGWTIACNDRVVVFNDKTRLTGWGESGVPSYHSQFIGITGIVHFKCNDAWKLPMTTTKRGVDTSSELYMFVKDLMKEGMKRFTQYTNKWKPEAEKERAMSSAAKLTSFGEMFSLEVNEKWTALKGGNGARLIPDLPKPKAAPVHTRQIKFARHIKEIEMVSDHLFGVLDVPPSEVGEKCFDIILEQAHQS